MSNNKTSLWENFVKDFPKFRAWALNDWEKSELQDQGALSLGQDIHKEAMDYLYKNPELTIETSTAILDELLAVYFGSYCDHGDGKALYELTGPMMKTWKYEESTKLVNKHCDEQTVAFWNRLHRGCSSNSKLNASQSLSKDLIVGWWRIDEMKKMEVNLSKAFPSKSYFEAWNERRRTPHFNAKEAYQGLEYVYDVLDIALKENKEVVYYYEIE